MKTLKRKTPRRQAPDKVSQEKNFQQLRAKYRRKKIEGKYFTLDQIYSSKIIAQAKAKKMRPQGYNVRVVNIGRKFSSQWPWAVYFIHKGK